MPSYDDIWMIARKVKLKENEWEDVGRELGLAEDSLGAIKQRNLSLLESSYFLLIEWRKSASQDRPSTFSTLHDALLKRGIEKAAEEILDLVCKRFALKSSGDTYLDCIFGNTLQMSN